MNPSQAVLLAGGYGLVGRQVAQILRQRHPHLPLLIAGRNLDQAAALANQLAPAQAVVLDVSQPTAIQSLKPRAVLALTNDPDHHLLLAAVHCGIPYLDITRWTEQVHAARQGLEGVSLRAPVIMASAWMAGVPALAAVALARQLERVDQIDVSILYSLKDQAGPNSVTYMDRLATPFTVTADGREQTVLPLTSPQRVRFPGGQAATVYRIDTPEQFSLPRTTGAQTVSTRMAFDDALTTSLLVFLTRSGLWQLLNRPRFTRLRQSLLYNPGSGAPHEVVVEVSGKATAGPRRLRAEISDPLGQSHLTAAGAVIQLERLLGLDGQPAPAPWLSYPDTAPNLPAAWQTLDSLGVTVRFAPA